IVSACISPRCACRESLVEERELIHCCLTLMERFIQTSTEDLFTSLNYPIDIAVVGVKISSSFARTDRKEDFPQSRIRIESSVGAPELTVDPKETFTVSAMQECDCEDSVSTTGLSTAAVVAIVCNILVALLILALILILCKACKVPSSQERVPVLTLENAHQRNEQKYLLTT
ncbi:hypothetical protein IRJ41_018028, partial [Triplophysa rosa]